MLSTHRAMPRLHPRWLLFKLSLQPKPAATSIYIRSLATKKPVNLPDAASPPLPVPQVRLRYYQEECIQSVLASIQNGHKRLGVSLATGAGKTVIFTQLIDRIQPGPNGANQTLILAHRRELVEQAARHCSNAYPTKTVEVELGNTHASGAADITIASMQSILSGDRMSKFDAKQFKLILVDEAHHIVSPGYLEILRHFGLHHKQETSPILLGVSATFSRFDGLRLGAAIDEIVYHKDYVDMIGEKWLSDVIFTTVDSKVDMSRVKSTAHGDFQAAALSKAVNTEYVNEVTVRSWLAKGAGRKSTLVFCVDLAHVFGLTETFRRYGIDARYVHGDTPKSERGDCVHAFKRGDFPVLVNCGVFTEGTDIPNIDCVILGRPTKSRNLLVQMIGRGMRLHPGKVNCHIIDMVSSLETGIVTTPTLFGLDPSQIVNDATVGELRSLKERREAEEAKKQKALATDAAASGSQMNGKVSFVEYDSVFDLIADTSGEKHIRSISQYAWVQVAADKYILSAGPEKTYIRLEKEATSDADDARYIASEVRALPSGVLKSPFATPRRLLEASTFADAVHGADKYASEKYTRALIHRYQRWREAPPTDGQLKFLNRLRGKDAQLEAKDITKGKATDMILKLKHGARGRFAAFEADKRRQERRDASTAQAEAMKLREKVTVGPLSA
ncbi:P-loop containing nucleoside triphosphate hydrolase protein [Xylariomycetidae sp. FL2044]|nr:P-loop containing nucleoside triphosphate hydrolase protein [Xylariomycetidae sp. FL2044]